MQRVKKILTKDLISKLRYMSLIAAIAVVALLILNNIDNGNKQQLEAAIGENQPYSIYIVAGQSNAEGTNSYVSQMPPGQELGSHPADDDANPDDNALLWWEGADGNSIQDDPNGFVNFITSGGTYNPAGWMQSDNTDDPSKEGLINFKDLDRPPPIGQRNGQFGPEVGIARELYDQGKRKIIILKVSYGFQALANTTTAPNVGTPFIPFDWYPDIPGQPSRNKSYYHLKKAYSELTTYLKNNGQKYTVDGMFWLQGETDSLDSKYTAKFEENFELLVNRSREDFGFHPDAHFVTRKFNMGVCTDGAYPLDADYCGFGYAIQLDGISPSNLFDALTVNALISIPLNNQRIRTVRDAFQKISDKYSWVDAVETDDAPFYGDYIHLNAEGQLITGKRMAKMYKHPYYPPQTASLATMNNYDGDSLQNNQEDVGRGASCPYVINGVSQPLNYTANNGNLGDDDTDCDGFPNYIDRINGPGSGLATN